MGNRLAIQQMMLRKLVSRWGGNVMKIHTFLKSISDTAMTFILKSKILTTVEENRSECFRIFDRGQLSMCDIKPETIKEMVDRVAYKNIKVSIGNNRFHK